MKTFTITILGTSSAVPTSKRYTSAHVLKVHEHFYLFDCGEATQIRIRQENIPLSKLYRIFISHLHGDHFYGLFGLLSSFKLYQSIKEVHIYAHEQLENIIKTVFKTDDLSFCINFHKIPMESICQIYEDKYITVSAIPIKHRIPASAFIVKQKPRLLKIKKDKIQEYNLSIKDIVKIKQGNDYISPDGKVIPNEIFTFPPEKPKLYAYVTDTIYDESIVPHIYNADLLYHEATFTNENKEIAYISGHSTALQAATIAKLANVKKLIIGHFSTRYKDRTVFLEEAIKIFPNTILADEGLTIEF